MTKKEARIEALRICSADLNTISGQLDFENEFSNGDEEKVRAAITEIANSLSDKAKRLGGDFNIYTGLAHGRNVSPKNIS